MRQVPVCALPLPCRGPVSYLEQAEQKVGYAQQRLRSSCKQGRGTASSRLLQHRAAAWSGGLRAKKVEREGRQHPGGGWAQGGRLQLRTPQGTRSTDGSESFKRDVQVGVSSESKATLGWTRFLHHLSRAPGPPGACSLQQGVGAQRHSQISPEVGETQEKRILARNGSALLSVGTRCEFESAR